MSEGFEWDKLVPYEEVLDPETYHCGAQWSYRVYDEYDYEVCGERAVACYEEQGRCREHLPEFEYLEAYGFIPKPKFVLQILDGPRGFVPEWQVLGQLYNDLVP